MTIENRNLAPGTKLAARYKGTTYIAEVVQTDEGIRYKTEDGQLFKSPSKAGSHVMKGIACNGWRFWNLEEDLPEPGERREGSDTRTSRNRRSPQPTRLIRRVPNQKGLDEGTSRWWCSACMASFVVEGHAEPDHCPEDHPRDAVDEVDMV